MPVGHAEPPVPAERYRLGCPSCPARKMPRGFLVKRSRRPGGSYRLRPPDALREEAPAASAPLAEPPPPSAPLAAAWEAEGSDCAAAPQAEEPQTASPPLPPSPSPASEKHLPRTPLAPPPPPPPASPAPPLCPPGTLKRPPRAKAPPQPLPPAKKPKAARKLSFADEVTTSPVLGLRIKAASEAGCEGSRAGRPATLLLGDFVCQLCQEPYADPLALAQHRCSRIVRVEYRCPECHKLFSCPANLASHRRWHKPRPPAAPAAAAGPAQDKENSRTAHQHHDGPDSACCPDPARTAASSPGLGLSPGGGELFLCPYCRKTFRRQAYLRKHLGTHQPPGLAGYRALSPPPPPPPPPAAFPCHLCGAHFPSAELRDKHRLWHAVREELLLPLGPPDGSATPGQAQQIFSCKHCPATFFSSPGLTRHSNKCHPSENRQLLLLQMPLRPGC